MNRKHRPNHFTAVALLAGLAIIASACTTGASPTAPQGSAAARPMITVNFYLDYLRSIAFWPVHLAEQLGYFRDEGLNLRSQATDGSSFVVQQVAAGAAEFGIAAADPILLGYGSSPNYKIVYDFKTGNLFDLWVVKGQGLTALADLRGKTVAVKDLSGGEVPGLQIALSKAGLTAGTDVKIQAVGEEAAVEAQALQNGTVQAIDISWNSEVGLGVALQKLGTTLVCLTCDASTTLASESVIVSNAFLQAHPDYVAGMGRALAKATLFGETNPDAAIAIMKTVNPDEQTDPVYTKTYFTAALAITKPRADGKFGEVNQDAWNREMQLILDPTYPSGLASAVPLADLIDNTFVTQYNTFDQAAVKAQATNYKP